MWLCMFVYGCFSSPILAGEVVNHNHFGDLKPHLSPSVSINFACGTKLLHGKKYASLPIHIKNSEPTGSNSRITYYVTIFENHLGTGLFSCVKREKRESSWKNVWSCFTWETRKQSSFFIYFCECLQNKSPLEKQQQHDSLYQSRKYTSVAVPSFLGLRALRHIRKQVKAP
jgi:hypothetical protein